MSRTKDSILLIFCAMLGESLVEAPRTEGSLLQLHWLSETSILYTTECMSRMVRVSESMLLEV